MLYRTLVKPSTTCPQQLTRPSMRRVIHNATTEFRRPVERCNLPSGIGHGPWHSGHRVDRKFRFGLRRDCGRRSGNPCDVLVGIGASGAGGASTRPPQDSRPRPSHEAFASSLAPSPRGSPWSMDRSTCIPAGMERLAHEARGFPIPVSSFAIPLRRLGIGLLYAHPAEHNAHRIVCSIRPHRALDRGAQHQATLVRRKIGARVR
jgi:hypothetical protein